MFELVRGDILAFNPHVKKRRFFSRIVRGILNPDFRVVVWFRIYSCLYRWGLRGVSTIIYFSVKRRFSCDIPPSVVIGPGLRLVHAFNIVIGERAVLGKGVKIFNGVSIGKLMPTRVEAPMPTIADFVVLGTGAKILGKVDVNPCTVVGANVVLTERNCFRNPKGYVKNPDNRYLDTLSAALEWRSEVAR